MKFLRRWKVSVYEKLNAMQISLPPVTAPVASFLPFVQAGNLIFVSGHIARREGHPWSGKVGEEISLSKAREAARAVAIDLLGALHAATGDLNKIKRIVKLIVLVNGSPMFTEPHLVANGASDLLIEIFGNSGRHARTAFCVAQTPFGSCVELDLIAEV
jgi:enamine deaminase RidA (YjgF/YER057c/UK114 family)